MNYKGASLGFHPEGEIPAGATIKLLMLSLISVVRNSVGFPLDDWLSPMNPYKLIVGLAWLA